MRSLKFSHFLPPPAIRDTARSGRLLGHLRWAHFAPRRPEVKSGFEQSLVARLLADELLIDLIGDRLFPLETPEQTPRNGARLLYAITANERVRCLSGPVGVATARVHFDARSPRYVDCKSIQEILRQYDGFRGTLAGDIRILFAQLETHGDEYEWPDNASDQGMQHLSLTFYFKYREPRPVAP